MDEYGNPVEPEPEPESEESVEIRGLRALHEEMHKTRVAVLWIAWLMAAMLALTAIVAFGGIELRFSTS